MPNIRRIYRDAGEAGLNAPGLSDAFHEGFHFDSYEQYKALLAIRPDLDPSKNAGEDLRKAWVAFAQSSVGKALRVR